MKTFKPKWRVVTELLLMAVLVVAIIALPRISESNRTSSPSTGPNLVKSVESGFFSNPSDVQDSDLEFIDHALKEISSWEVDRIEPLLAAPTKKDISDRQLESIAATLEVSLGELEHYAPPRYVDSAIAASSNPDMDVDVFLIDAVYENANANITFHIVEENGKDVLQLLDMDVEDMSSEDTLRTEVSVL